MGVWSGGNIGVEVSFSTIDFMVSLSFTNALNISSLPEPTEKN